MPDALPDSVRAHLDDPFASLTGSLAGTTRLTFEVASSQRISPNILSWLHRLSRPADDPLPLAAEATEVELPPGDGHAYVLGEAKLVSRLRDILASPRPAAGPGLGQGLLGPGQGERRPRRARQTRMTGAAVGASRHAIECGRADLAIIVNSPG